MSALLTSVGGVFTAAIGWVGDVASAIAGFTTSDSGTTFKNPVLLLFCVAVPLCGIGISFFKRLLSSRG